jgi:hypothetical protein
LKSPSQAFLRHPQSSAVDTGFPAFGKPALAGEARSQKLMHRQKGLVRDAPYRLTCCFSWEGSCRNLARRERTRLTQSQVAACSTNDLIYCNFFEPPR